MPFFCINSVIFRTLQMNLYSLGIQGALKNMKNMNSEYQNIVVFQMEVLLHFQSSNKPQLQAHEYA